MEKNIIEDLEKNLKNLKQKNVIINQKGFLESKYLINNLKYFIESDILNILDEKEQNYIKINLNQVYKIYNKEKIIFYLDNDTTIILDNYPPVILGDNYAKNI